MNIRVSKRVAITGVLALVGLLAFSSYRSIRIHSISIADRTLESGGNERSTDPQELLATANHLYWLYNGPKAAPLFARAEKLFADKGDSRNELYAKVGRLRSEAERMSFVELCES